MADPSSGLTSLDSILCTHELEARPSQPPDRERENRALVALMEALAESPQYILQTLSDTILQVLKCGSSGISLLTNHDGGKRFYWPAISGRLKPYIGEGTPREFGPCGTVLDQNRPLLMKNVGKFYTYLEALQPTIKELLLVPFYSQGHAVGTVWAISHDAGRHFDSEDKRQLETLARFASGAYQVITFSQSREQLAAIVDSCDDAIVSKNLNGIILSWNKGAERIFGYTAEEAVGMPITTIIPPDLQREEKDILNRLRNGERIDHFETIRVKKDGSRVNVALTISPVRDNAGNVVGASKTARDITERRRFEAALKESEFSARLLKVQDEDRRRIARELHDGVGQLLAAVGINISAVSKERDKLSPDVARRVEENAGLIQQASADIRTVSYLLHPPMLDDIGLQSALEWYVEGFAERSKIVAHLDFPEGLERLPQDLELIIFRIAQECLTNIHRHAKCTSALVKLSINYGKLVMEVRDDGHGIEPEVQEKLAAGNSSGVGLRGMQERVASVGGTFKIESDENGTSVAVTLPLASPRQN